MHKTFLSFTFTLLSLCISIGQNVMDSQGTIGDFGYITIPADKNNDIKGTPYITEDYVPAKISVLKNKIYRVKYNALMDEIVVLGEDDATYGLDKHGRRDITITILGSRKSYQVFNYLDDRDFETIGYFIHVTPLDSNIKLLKKERIKFVDAKKSINSYSQSEPAHYKRENDKYYIKNKDQIAVLLPANKKKIAQLFPDIEKAILKFIKAQNINVKKETGLVAIINHINQLNSGS